MTGAFNVAQMTESLLKPFTEFRARQQIEGKIADSLKFRRRPDVRRRKLDEMSLGLVPTLKERASRTDELRRMAQDSLHQ